jgi:hypothetical protein
LSPPFNEPGDIEEDAGAENDDEAFIKQARATSLSLSLVAHFPSGASRLGAGSQPDASPDIFKYQREI